MGCYWGMVWKYDTNTSYSYIEASRNSLKNQIGCTLPSIILFNQLSDMSVDTHFLSSIFLIPFIIVVSDVYFFLSHYPLHKTFLWKYHKTHHHGTVHVAKSLDADLLEHLFGNLGSFIAPFIVLNIMNISFNVIIYNIWVAIATINTCISHIGYKTLGDKGIHNLHHKYLKYNYGTGFYILDRLVGTYKEI
jgi:sterol desaturase/sphingolipid hydroxylase (fatty acid hydroxylase superfamily)